MGAESILYHARMRVLQSRQGSRRSSRQAAAAASAGISTATSRRSPGASTSSALPPTRFTPKQPCTKEKIVPPPECLPREKAFRYAYLKHHQPNNIKKMPSLKQKMDPKRKIILERIRATERAKREQDEAARAKAASEAEAARVAEAAAKEKSKRLESKKPPRLPPVSGIQSPTSVATLPPVAGSSAQFTSRWYDEDSSSSSEEEGGGSFGFLSQWSSFSPSSTLSPTGAKRKLPALK